MLIKLVKFVSLSIKEVDDGRRILANYDKYCMKKCDCACYVQLVVLPRDNSKC